MNLLCNKDLFYEKLLYVMAVQKFLMPRLCKQFVFCLIYSVLLSEKLHGNGPRDIVRNI